MTELGSQKKNPKFESQSIDRGAGSAGDCRRGTFIFSAQAGMEDQAQGEDCKEHLRNASILPGEKKKRERKAVTITYKTQKQTTYHESTNATNEVELQGDIGKSTIRRPPHHFLTPSCDRLPEVHTGSRAMEINQRESLA